MTTTLCRLIRFAHFPIAGKLKTPLTPSLEAEHTALRHHSLPVYALRTNGIWCQSQRVEREIFARNDHKPAVITPPDELTAQKRFVEVDETDLSRISIIIPALNEAVYIAATLQSVCADRPHEILVVDGGSTDDTRAIAQAAGATVIHSKPGRARQMNAGAARATGNVLIFLHADTLLAPDYLSAVSEALREQKVAAGAFRFRIRGNITGKRIVEWTTNLRSRLRQMPFGDQALFLRKSLFEELGGYANLSIMEDYDLVRRLRQSGSIVTIAHAATTSGRRWRRLGLLRTTAINQLMILGYHCRIAPERLVSFYRR